MRELLRPKYIFLKTRTQVSGEKKNVNGSAGAYKKRVKNIIIFRVSQKRRGHWILNAFGAISLYHSLYRGAKRKYSNYLPYPETDFQRRRLAEFGCGGRSFAGDPEGCVLWGGRGTVARPRGVGWRSGAAGVKDIYDNRQL